MTSIRVGICLLISFAVLAFGGVEYWGQAALEIGAAVLFVLWAAKTSRCQKAEIRWNWLYLPLLGLGGVGLAQYALGLSAYPYLTKIELLKWFAYVLIFFLTVHSFRTEKELKQFVWFLLSLGFGVSVFAIVQYFAFNGKLYWLVPVPDGAAPFGPFVNSNHFAGFVELIVPLGFALLLFPSRRQGRENLILLLLFTIVPAGAIVLSSSRGGIMSLLLELALLASLSRMHRIGRKEIVGAAGIALLAASFTLWLGIGPALQRFEQLTRGGIARDLRLSMYEDTWRIFGDHPWSGTGLGTLVTVFPKYASFYDGSVVDHAHNDYLELLAETGLLGGLCGLSFVGLLFWQGLKSLRSAAWSSARAIRLGSLVACAGLLVHSLVDFNLHIPSNALIFLLLSAVATAEMAEQRVDRIARVYARRTNSHENRSGKGHRERSEPEIGTPQVVAR